MEDGFAALMAKVASERGFGCASYKERCLRRRVSVRMRARGVGGFDEYARLLDHDAAEYDRLLSALTINVTRLFRNRETWHALEHDVVPALLARDGTLIRVWSAGCATGHEAWSLAVLFHRRAVASRGMDRLAQVRIVGTDVDAAVLETAERAEFEPADFAEVDAGVRRRYFDARPPYGVHEDVRGLVTFRRGDLLRDAPPFRAHELILCRNVLIYFDKPTQERLLRQFHDALVPGGFLVLGKVETILGPSRALFEVVNGRERIYRRQ